MFFRNIPSTIRPARPRTATLVCTQAQWTELRGHLVQPDKMEYASFGVLGRADTGAGVRYYIHRLTHVPKSACTHQNGAFVEPNMESVVAAMSAYGQGRGAACLHAHSHPFCAHADFSGGDDAYRPGIIRGLYNFLKGTNSGRPCRYLRWVTGQEETGFTGEVFDEHDRLLDSIEQVRIVGDAGWRVLHRFEGATQNSNGVTERELARLDRNIRWLGEDGQGAISEAHVAICGLGGLGAEFAKNCRGLGFRKYTLVDMDHVEASSLNRLPYGLDSIGRLKVEAARDLLLDAIPDAQITILARHAEASDVTVALTGADVIVSAVDDDSTRLSLQVLAARHLIPLVEMGAGISLDDKTRAVRRMGGQVRVYIPGGPCLACLGLDPGKIVSREMRAVQEEVGYVQGTNETPTAVVTLNAMVAGLAAHTLAEYITGFSKPVPWMSMDLTNPIFLPIHAESRENCAICGLNGAEGLGAEPEPAEPDSNSDQCLETLPPAPNYPEPEVIAAKAAAPANEDS